MRPHGRPDPLHSEMGIARYVKHVGLRPRQRLVLIERALGHAVRLRKFIQPLDAAVPVDADQLHLHTVAIGGGMRLGPATGFYGQDPTFATASSWYYGICRWLTSPPVPVEFLRPIVWRGRSPLTRTGDAQTCCPVPASPAGTLTFRRFQS